eukprot:CAMPEP_0204308706 /NCGR_PEP_ID=MMETSP0469-20131031/663_1 /ASSEMBLY_ACC=CAM_ASM_000384 /TAXON_ID=2969 /ORGANISM="Oxyrrhis marina" /LENGTH=581 /DNA_ID=CAMNT_0051288225 /DNA_START=7 /DNA_END=1752 /DNA_ORIENTATION=-
MEPSAKVAKVGDSVSSLCAEWATLDLNPTTRDEVAKWASTGAAAAACLSSKRLAFGTAGLRGPMGIGYGCMNDVIVLQAAQGFSKRFAHLTAAVFLSKGAKVQLYSKFVATPLVPFQLLKSDALCGVVVTASHNPKQDNGFKVYASNGAQICAPIDDEIAACIASNLKRWDQVAELLDQPSGELTAAAASKVVDPYATATEDYFAALSSSLCAARDSNKASALKFVYTAMHGVGYPFTSRMMKEFGFEEGKHFWATPEQNEPDPEFPTAAFPNPEEKGALTLSMACATKHGADYVIANDPDADRFTAAEKVGDKYLQFTGDELGCLFADWMVTKHCESGKSASSGLLVNSAVSSRMLAAIAKHHGCQYSDALTGFKWLANCSAKLCEEKSLIHLLAYEEAIGYQLSPMVKDKDGVSASGVFCEMAVHWHSKGTTIRGRLDQLSQQVGYFATHNGYFLCYEPEVMAKIFDDFRNGGKYPTVVGDLELSSVRDVTKGLDTGTADGKSHLPATPKDQMMTLCFKDGSVITLRGSGTEPKLKYYTESSDPTGSEAAQKRAQSVAEVVIKHVLRPAEHGLQPPKTG